MTFSQAQITPNSAEYQRIHRWVHKTLGKAKQCSINAAHTSTRFEWSNISRKYLKKTSDWQQLCKSCHRYYDAVSPEAQKRLNKLTSIRAKGNGYHNTPILRVSPNGSWIKFESTVAALKHTNVNRTSISNVLAGRAKTAGGYKWRRIAS